ncbi:hypothetical protein ABW20_dc0103621 [Dactylellina cionopaga]|nr:hypothetical protein ABW20_dc0103621 [Dactylellina cionopaga]
MTQFDPIAPSLPSEELPVDPDAHPRSPKITSSPGPEVTENEGRNGSSPHVSVDPSPQKTKLPPDDDDIAQFNENGEETSQIINVLTEKNEKEVDAPADATTTSTSGGKSKDDEMELEDGPIFEVKPELDEKEQEATRAQPNENDSGNNSSFELVLELKPKTEYANRENHTKDESISGESKCSSSSGSGILVKLDPESEFQERSVATEIEDDIPQTDTRPVPPKREDGVSDIEAKIDEKVLDYNLAVKPGNEVENSDGINQNSCEDIPDQQPCLSPASEQLEGVSLSDNEASKPESNKPSNPDDSTNLSPQYPSPFPFPNEVIQNILKRLRRSDLHVFALTSKASYITSLSILARSVVLPLADHEDTIRMSLDLSNPVFYTTNFPGDLKIRKTLHKFKNLRHLVVLKSTSYASDAVLGALIRYLVEQYTLEELTLDLNCNTKTRSVVELGPKLSRCWTSLHHGAIHNYPRKLKTLNFTIKNQNVTSDGLCAARDFWHTMLSSVRKINIDIEKVIYASPAATQSLPKGFDYLRMLGSSRVVDLEITFDNMVQKPYSEIGINFPNLERLKVNIIGCGKTRQVIELCGLGRMKYLQCINLPWAYEVVSQFDTGIIGMLGKAKEKAKEVVQAKSAAECKEEKLKTHLLKQTKSLAAIQRLVGLKDVTWRYTLEEGGQETMARFLLEWGHGEHTVKESTVGGKAE